MSRTFATAAAVIALAAAPFAQARAGLVELVNAKIGSVDFSSKLELAGGEIDGITGEAACRFEGSQGGEKRIAVEMLAESWETDNKTFLRARLEGANLRGMAVLKELRSCHYAIRLSIKTPRTETSAEIYVVGDRTDDAEAARRFLKNPRLAAEVSRKLDESTLRVACPDGAYCTGALGKPGEPAPARAAPSRPAPAHPKAPAPRAAEAARRLGERIGGARACLFDDACR